MTIICGAPDPTLGVAVRLAAYLDCQGRSLGENGFQALAGGPIGTSVLSGLVTIFIALIGYRLILGHSPTMRDGVGWSVRLGMVLALVTSWPAFQAMAYRVVVDGPTQLAATILPAAGLPSEQLDIRVQQAYDTIRLGVMNGQAVAAAPQANGSQNGQATPASQQIHFQSPLPNTASLLVISTSGLTGILKIAVGFLLAIAPLAMMSLLFNATLGLFNGWVRSLVGSSLAVLGATIFTAIDLMLVESELARLQAYRIGAVSAVVDPQALTTIVALFTLASIVVTVAAMRTAGALKLRMAAAPITPQLNGRAAEYFPHGVLRPMHERRAEPAVESGVPHRAAMVREALTKSVLREQEAMGATTQADAQSRHLKIGEAVSRRNHSAHGRPGGRRELGKQRRSAARRDKRA